MRNSSYAENDYGQLIQGIVHLYKPKTIIEFGILQGYSLHYLITGAGKKARVVAYDLFEDYPYKHANREICLKRFGDKIIQYGDFYKKYQDLDDNSIDMFHIDISNTGKTYQFFLDHYWDKLAPGGIALLEGGSEERDKIAWMVRFGMQPIRPVLQSNGLDYFTFTPWPSLTLIGKPNEDTLLY